MPFGRPAENETLVDDGPLWFFYASCMPGRPKAAVFPHGQRSVLVTINWPS